MRYEVLIIGCGEIGTSLIRGWLNKPNKFFKKVSRVYVLESDNKKRSFLKREFKEKVYFIKANKKNGISDPIKKICIPVDKAARTPILIT